MNCKEAYRAERCRAVRSDGKAPPVYNYLSKMTCKLGADSDDLFTLTKNVDYSFEAHVRPIFASDREDGGDFFKASEMHFNTHTITSMRASLMQNQRALGYGENRPNLT